VGLDEGLERTVAYFRTLLDDNILGLG
jgi:hypothetical protein